MLRPAIWIGVLWASMTIAYADDPAAVPALEARFPVFNNRNCPIMGKRASTALFVDTDFGRIYVCCPPCIEEILANTAAGHRAAYPVVKKITNATCPVTGLPIGKDAMTLVLQGFEFSLASAEHIDKARATSQFVLARLINPALRDVGNMRCPVTGDRVSSNTPVLVGDDLVHLAGRECLAAVEKDPAGILAKAKAIAAEDFAAAHNPTPPLGPTRENK